MPLLAQIEQEMIKALKSGDRLAADTFRGLKSDIKYYQIENSIKEVSDDDVIAVITKAAKKRRDSIEQYAKGGRQDLVDKESAELKLIEAYLPEQMSEEDIEAIVRSAIAETGATGPPDMGKVMKVVMPKVAGQADGKAVKAVVTRLLNA